MGQEATGLMRYGSPKERAIELSAVIARRRERLGALLTEIEHRRRELFDIRLQLRNNGLPLLLMATGLGGIVAFSLGARARRVHNEQRLVARFRRAKKAVSRALKDPDRVAAPPPDLGKKVLVAIASAVATTLVTAVVKRIVEEVIVPPARAGAHEIRRAALPESTRMTPRPVLRG